MLLLGEREAGRQRTRRKRGWGERERVVERLRVSVPVNCIGLLHAFSKYVLSTVCWSEPRLLHDMFKYSAALSLFPPSLFLIFYLHFLVWDWLSPSPILLPFLLPLSLARALSNTHMRHKHAQVVISCFPPLSSACAVVDTWKQSLPPISTLL